MKNDIALLLERIREVDLSTADADTLQSVGGLLLMLLHSHPDVPLLLSSVYEVVLSHFKEATTMADQSRWLQVLLYINGYDRDTLFCDVLDDDEFELLEARQEEVERWWQSEPHIEESLPLTEWHFMEQEWRSRLGELFHIQRPLFSGLSEADLVSSGCKSLHSDALLQSLI